VWSSTSVHKPATVTKRKYSTPLIPELINSFIQVRDSQVFSEVRFNVINFRVCQVAAFQLIFPLQSSLYDEGRCEILIVRTFTGYFHCRHTKNGSFIVQTARILRDIPLTTAVLRTAIKETHCIMKRVPFAWSVIRMRTLL